MPRQTLQLIPGVNTTRTVALNQACISECNLIRSSVDNSGLGLVQKLGGWAKYFPNAMPSIVRALWGWQDSHVDQKHLAVGCETSATPNVGAFLGVITDGTTLTDLTPHVLENNPAVDLSSTSGSNQIIIKDTGSNITNYDSVNIPTHIAIGGVVVYGFYQCQGISADTYAIYLVDSQNNPINATATVNNAGTIETFTTISGQQGVTVTLVKHGYTVGQTYPVAIQTTVGGITLEGTYIVQSVTSADAFVIYGATEATSSTTASINSGDARYDYFISFGPLPAGTGYGVAGYGEGGYGTGVPVSNVTGDNIETGDWVLDNFGFALMACPTSITFGSPTPGEPRGGPLYYWSSEGNTFNAVPIPEAPVTNAGFFIGMPQRQVISYGCTFNGIRDPLLVRWCDVGNFHQWNRSPTNQAGSYRLSRGSEIVGGMQVAQQGLLWTDVGLWAMQYTGFSAGVYSFSEVGIGCGLIAQKAAGVLGGITYWMGQSQFFVMASGIQPMLCTVWDNVFQDLDTDNKDKIRCAVNSNFNEVTWYYPSTSGGTGEVDKYVKYNAQTGLWDSGFNDGQLKVARTAWINQSVLGPPIGADGNSFVQQHEISNDADNQSMTPYFITGWFTLADGDVMTFLDSVWPDMKWGQANGTSTNATIKITFYAVDHPDDTPNVYGPYTVTRSVKALTPHFRNRLIRIKIESDDFGTFWRLGALRYRYAPDGKFAGAA
jgi:hypothetical protein